MIRDYDVLLRPKCLSQIVGQTKVKTVLNTVITAARNQRIPVGHILFTGPAGTGKTTLAHVVANEMKSPCWATTGTNLATQLANYDTLFKKILPTFEEHGIIFVDEIHRVANLVQDTLLPLLERNWLAIKYRSPRSGLGIRKGDWVALSGTTKAFTFIAATTRSGLLQDPFRARFKLELELDFYNTEALFQIAERSAWLLELGISSSALHIIAQRSKGIPRLTNRYLWYCRQYQIANDYRYINACGVQKTMHELNIDALGLDKLDRKLLSYLAELDRPTGATTLCAYLSIDRATLETVLEPHLLRLHLIIKTARGRTITPKAIKHLKNPFDNAG